MRRISPDLLQNVGLLLIRVMVGVVFVFHGSQKMFGLFDGQGLAGFTAQLAQMQFPWPQYAAVSAASAEFFGGIAFILGAWTRIASIPLAATMFVASFIVHKHAFSIQHQGMEYALTLAVFIVAIGLMGPGRFSLGSLLSGRLSARARAPEPLPQQYSAQA